MKKTVKAEPNGIEMKPQDHEQIDKLVDIVRDFDERKAHSLIDDSVNRSQHLSDDDQAVLQKALRVVSMLHNLQPSDGDETHHDVPSTHDELDRAESTQFSTATSNNELPKQIGRFEIVRLIGEGGFAHVFLARDPSLNRQVALKVPKPHVLVSPESRERFSREAKAAAVLSHPAIVPVFESGNAGPVTYIVSEYCEGNSLAGWFDRQERTTTPLVAAQVVARLAEAVHHAHQRGVVHRDLKPANVLIGGGDEDIGDCVRITDFGLAKQASERNESLTVDGAVIGTPAYMSPEQARGSRQSDSRTDIYSLGVILYELLSGRIPFDGESHLAVLRAVEVEPPTPLNRIRREIPRDLEVICLKCLEKEPDRRYSTAFDLSQDLTNWMEGRPITARTASPVERLWRWAQRRPALAASLTFAIAALVTGLSLTTWKWQESLSNLKLAQTQTLRAESHLGRTQDTIEQFLGDVAANPGIPSELRGKLVNQVVQLQEELLEDEPENARSILQTSLAYRHLAEWLLDTGDYSRAIEVCDAGMQLFGRLPTDYPVPQDKSLTQFTMLRKTLENNLKLRRKDDSGSVEPLATGNSVDATATNPHEQAIMHHLEGIRLIAAADPEAAVTEFEKALAEANRLPQDNVFVQADRALFILDLASAKQKLDEHESSIRLTNEALELLNAAGKVMPFHADLEERRAKGLKILAFAHFAEQRNDESLAIVSKAIEVLGELRKQNEKNIRLAADLADLYSLNRQIFVRQHKWQDVLVEADRLDQMLHEVPELLAEYSRFLPANLESRLDVVRAFSHFEQYDKALAELERIEARITDELATNDSQRLRRVQEECKQLRKQF